MTSNTPRIVELARTINDSVAAIDAGLAARGLPSPSFHEHNPEGYLPRELSGARDAVLDATAELHDLLLEPLHLVKKHGGSNNSVCLQAIARYRIANIVPVGGEISFADIGTQTGLGERMALRLLRHAMTMRIFHEPKSGYVGHTKASRMISGKEMNAWLMIGTEKMWPAATKMLEALEKWPGSQEPNETGFSLSQNSVMSIYDFVGSSPERGARFAESMVVWATRPDYAPVHAIRGYDWASLRPLPPSPSPSLLFPVSDAPRVRVVDVGGARGHVTVTLARQFPNLDIVVQDIKEVIEGADAELPEDLRRDGRVKFMAHDLFAPQPVAARVFFFRWILHNWADKHCIAILRAQIPVLEPGARIIIMDTVMPDPGKDDVGLVPLWVEQDLRSEDLNMGAVFNSQERTLREWKALLAEADSRFKLETVSKPEGSTLALISAEWSPSNESLSDTYTHS